MTVWKEAPSRVVIKGPGRMSRYRVWRDEGGREVLTLSRIPSGRVRLYPDGSFESWDNLEDVCGDNVRQKDAS